MTLTPPFFRRATSALFFIAISALSTSATATNSHKKFDTKKTAIAADKQDSAPRPKAVQGTTPYAERADALQFAEDLAARRDLDPAWVRETIGQARFLPKVPALMLPPAHISAKNWRAYRSRFIEPIRIRAGVRFWQQHSATLTRAERQYGVPAEIIIGILGVETIYGQNMGNFRVIDALATLSFDFPSAHPRALERREFFRRELEQFLSLMQRQHSDPFEPLGSYAGAMGLPQFMPSSSVRYAVDFDGDNRINLFSSPQDAIGSVANYFIEHGWTPGMAPIYPVEFDPARLDMASLLAPDIHPTFSAAEMAAKGALVQGSGAQHNGPLALIELQNGGDTPSYVAGTGNFYAITRYNWSSYYAMAVIELGREVAAARARQR
ncbi:MAG: lytic murein transglycosylase B [Burkholderiaceae bacterium]|jgi:membrane-bound lytic murein transglycosylase B|nr:lytic murein transglycosylase B [Burkholderiaceae bacterium]